MLRTKSAKLLCLLLIAALCLGGCARPQETPEREQEFLTGPMDTPSQGNYKTVAVTTGGYTVESSGTGSVIYMVEQELYWEGRSARFRETLVKNGDTVTVGQPLMAFDIEESESEMAALKLELKRTKEDYASGKATKTAAIAEEKDRAKTLESYDREISLLKVEKLKAQYDKYVYETEKSIAQIEAEIAQIEAEIANNTLVAPFDGVVKSVLAAPVGDKVPTDKALVVIYSTDHILLQVKNGAPLRYNMSVTVEYGKNSNKQYLSGKVVSAPSLLPSSLKQSYALIQLDEGVDTSKLKGTLKFTTVTEKLGNILTVSKSAVAAEDGKDYVFILENGSVHKRFIIARRNKTEDLWILDGLSEGQLLIID